MGNDGNSIEHDRRMIQELLDSESQETDPVTAFFAIRQRLSSICVLPWDRLELVVDGDRAYVQIRRPNADSPPRKTPKRD